MKVPSIISILWDIAKVYWFLLQDIRHQRDEERLESVQIPVGITSVTLHDDEFAYTARLDGLMVPASKCGSCEGSFARSMHQMLLLLKLCGPLLATEAKAIE